MQQTSTPRSRRPASARVPRSNEGEPFEAATGRLDQSVPKMFRAFPSKHMNGIQEDRKPLHRNCLSASQRPDKSQRSAPQPAVNPSTTGGGSFLSSNVTNTTVFEKQDGQKNRYSLSADATPDVVLHEWKWLQEELAPKVKQGIQAGICRSGGKLQLSDVWSLSEILKLRENPRYAKALKARSVLDILKPYSSEFNVFGHGELTPFGKQVVIYIEMAKIEFGSDMFIF
eukprot:gnl/MRDRNA2_/MRDRNA2_36300_c0_seq1.p1 gnl/MRDRNA2_/MRDRNA2_36300_c0~~gnl/MRDRNA2_/MRDRNA2_36300_c0_seq1.p1  ORF type:complete len:228 (+),score=35.63 gnl/MRDRNA2_/MRDRNA2_36300_c0_seq1:83-766(+)